MGCGAWVAAGCPSLRIKKGLAVPLRGQSALATEEVGRLGPEADSYRLVLVLADGSTGPGHHLGSSTSEQGEGPPWESYFTSSLSVDIFILNT